MSGSIAKTSVRICQQRDEEAWKINASYPFYFSTLRDPTPSYFAVGSHYFQRRIFNGNFI